MATTLSSLYQPSSGYTGWTPPTTQVGGQTVATGLDYIPQVGTSGMESTIANMQGLSMSPSQLFQLRMQGIQEQSQASRSAMQEEANRNRWGAGSVYDWNRKRAFEDASALGNASAAARVESNNFNTQLQSAIANLQSNLRAGNIQQRGQDIDWLSGIREYFQF